MKKSSPSLKMLLGIIVVVLVAGVGLYSFGKNKYSKRNQINEALEVLASKDIEKIAEVIQTDYPGFELTPETIDSFIVLLEDTSSYMNDLQNLHREDQKDYFEVVQTRKIFGLFDKYELFVNPVLFEVKTDTPEATITVNGQEVHVTETADEIYTAGPYMPGIFEINVNAETNGFEFETSDTLSLFRSKDQDDAYVELPLDGKHFSVSSNLPGWDVIVNGNNLGTLNENGEGQFGPILWQPGFEVYAQKEYPSGILKTESQYIAEQPRDFNFQYDHKLNFRMISLIGFDLYFNIINHLQNADEVEDRADGMLQDLLIGGAENTLYSVIYDQVAENKTDTEAYEIHYDHSVNAIEHVDLDKFEIELSIIEERYYPRRSDKESTRDLTLHLATIEITEYDADGNPTALMIESIEPL